MKIKLLLFAAARDQLGGESIDLELPENSVLAELKQALVERYPESDALIKRSAFAVDQAYATEQTILKTDVEVAMIPPVSGG